jgi:gluconate 2-dehydrogenase gamma chain
MSDISRRDVLRRLALALTAAGTLDRVSAQEVHQMAAQAQERGPYTPQAFTEHEYRTLERLTDLIIPVENGKPGAVAAGCAAWIDTISSENDELKTIYTEGFAWVDAAMKRRGAELEPGIEFFSWVRRMTVDAFYTSEIGIKDIDYRGNSPMASYTSPTEAIAYALKRSGI